MKKVFASLAATGALTLAALAGTATSASAAVAQPTPGVHAAYATPNFYRYWAGPFANSQDCVNYVRSINELGVWDCEYYNPSPFWAGHPGWYATSPWYS